MSIKSKLENLRVGKSIKVGDGSITKTSSGFIYYSPRMQLNNIAMELAIDFLTSQFETEDKVATEVGLKGRFNKKESILDKEPEQLDFEMPASGDWPKLSELTDGKGGIKQGELFTSALAGSQALGQPKSMLGNRGRKGPK